MTDEKQNSLNTAVAGNVAADAGGNVAVAGNIADGNVAAAAGGGGVLFFWWRGRTGAHPHPPR